MRATQDPSNNDVVPAVNEDGPLHVTRLQLEGGQQALISFWKPSPAERAALAAGAAVALYCLGDTHPPVFMDVDGVAE